MTKAQLGNGAEHAKRFHEWDATVIPQQLQAVEHNDDEGLLAHTFLNAQPSKRSSDQPVSSNAGAPRRRLRWLDDGTRIPGSPIQPYPLERPASSEYSLSSPAAGAPTLRLPWGQRADSDSSGAPLPRAAPTRQSTSVLKGGDTWRQQQQPSHLMHLEEATVLTSGAAPRTKRPSTPAAIQPKKQPDFEPKKLPGIHSPSASPISSPTTVASSGFPGFHSRSKPDIPAHKSREQASTAEVNIDSDATQPASGRLGTQQRSTRGEWVAGTPAAASDLDGRSTGQQQSSAWQSRKPAFLPSAGAGNSVIQTSQGRSKLSRLSGPVSAQTPANQQPTAADALRGSIQPAGTHQRMLGQRASSSRKIRQENPDARSRMTQSALLLAYGNKATLKRSAVKGGARPTSAAAMMASSRQSRLSGSDRLANTASAYAIRQAHAMGQRRHAETRSSSQSRRERPTFNRGALSASSRL